METLSALQSLGLELPSPAYIVGAILFGLIGMAAYWHGKRAQQSRTRWWGVALMFYPYVVSATWLLYAGGVKYLLLSALLYAPGAILFAKAKREVGQPIFTNVEKLIFAAVVIGALVAAYGLYDGFLTL